MERSRFVGMAAWVLAFWAPAAAPHYIWIERAADAHAKLYFGEVQEGAREVSGGRLDEIRGPRAAVVNARGERSELAASRQKDHFDLGSAGGNAWVLAEELGYEVKDWTKQKIGIVKPMFYARLAPAKGGAAPEPGLTLDIVPLKGSSGGYAVYFRNAPLPKAKVMIYAPNAWMQEHVADDQGRVQIKTPWRGQYVLEVLHTEQQPGEFEGRRYEAQRHRATLTFSASAR